MEQTDLLAAKAWFESRGAEATIDGSHLHLTVDTAVDVIEVCVSSAEVSYRADLYRSEQNGD